MSFLFEIFLIMGLGILILRPSDLPLFMKSVARLVVWFRTRKKALENQWEALLRDVEVEDFKNASYKQYAEEVHKALHDAKERFK